VKLSDASVKQLMVRMLPAILVCIDSTAAAQAAIERETEELKKKGKKRDPKDDMHDFGAARAAFCDSLDAVLTAVGMKGICDVLKSNAVSADDGGSGGCDWSSLTTGHSLDAVVANILVSSVAQHPAIFAEVLVQIQSYSVAPGGRGYRPCIIAACGGFIPMCNKSAQHLSSLLAIIQKSAAAPEVPPLKKDSSDSVDDARRCAIAALGSIVQLSDSSKYIRNVISTLLQALSDNAGLRFGTFFLSLSIHLSQLNYSCMRSFAIFTANLRADATRCSSGSSWSVLFAMPMLHILLTSRETSETVCASVVPLMTFHVSKFSSKVRECVAFCFCCCECCFQCAFIATSRDR
jgi:hypothetical protein